MFFKSYQGYDKMLMVVERRLSEVQIMGGERTDTWIEI